MGSLAEGVVAGRLRALARVCRLVDDGVGDYVAILKLLFEHCGHAWTIGVTGTPGAGKSTLTDKLIAVFRSQGKRVGVVAVDPTSPFSGGAILGDRIRMQQHYDDDEVFIRSVATRGALGGLSRSATDIVRVMDAWQADVIVVETVGVGQDELEVSRTVDTTLVVTAPGMGDDVQAIKAGILECADVFAVNKADRDGADITARDLEMMVALGQSTRHATATQASPRGHAGAHAPMHAMRGADERPPGAGAYEEGPWDARIVRCIATRSVGVEELVRELEAHRAWLSQSEAGARRRLQRLREATHNQLRNALIDCAESHMGEAIDEAVRRIAAREIDPYTASEQLVARFASALA
jgi:LAO/AO transport system kinase